MNARQLIDPVIEGLARTFPVRQAGAVKRVAHNGTTYYEVAASFDPEATFNVVNLACQHLGAYGLYASLRICGDRPVLFWSMAITTEIPQTCVLL